MNILGLNISGFHSSACLIKDGEIQFAITEERLSRIKNDNNFPTKAIKYVCDNANISLDNINHVFIGWNVIPYMFKSDNTKFDSFQQRGKFAYFVLNELSSLVGSDKIKTITQELSLGNNNIKIHFINHHYAHLANSYFSSGFQTKNNNTNFLVLDGFGENSTGMAGFIKKEKNKYNINELISYRTPHSLGSFYSTFTNYLGFKPNSDEWKVMALAALGKKTTYYDFIKSLIKIDNINFELDLSFFEHYMFFTPNYYSPKLLKVLGPKNNGNLSQKEYDIAFALQNVVEETVIKILNNLYKQNPSDNLVVSGGFFMNSVLNGKILEKTKYKNIFIGGSPDDSGISIGSALYGSNVILSENTKHNLSTNYFGQSYSDAEIVNELEKRKISYFKQDNIEKYAAEQIRNKKIIAWFQGKSEFGQRALGNRSIIADPTNPNIKNLINESIKYREGFRPFAPSILEEKQDIYFSNKNNEKSFFMEKVFKFKKKYKNILPGVYHDDGTGRLQTVNKNTNPTYYKLITEFEKLSGHPIIINTSFNINGMPLVETPGDAIDCFYKSGIDILVLNNYIVKK